MKGNVASIEINCADFFFHSWVSGWLDQLKIKLTSVPVGLNLELVAELGKNLVGWLEVKF